MATRSAGADPSSIPLSNPPWKLKGTIYSFMFYSTAKEAASIGSNKALLYAPLEGQSSFSECKFIGGLGMIQIIRYTESPVGHYDEMLVVPGFFSYEKENIGKGDVAKVEKRKNVRITKIYVSQKETCYNGRTHWNIPKHLAHFTFTTLPDKRTSITVQPFDDVSGKETSDSSQFFSAIFKPIPYIPSIPASTNIAKYVGLDLNLVQPPLPKGESANGELPGTDRWCKIMPFEYSSKTSIGWWDLKQGVAGEEDPLLAGRQSHVGQKSATPEHENWWPGIGRWRIGMVMENADIEFPEGEYWTGPRL